MHSRLYINCEAGSSASVAIVTCTLMYEWLFRIMVSHIYKCLNNYIRIVRTMTMKDSMNWRESLQTYEGVCSLAVWNRLILAYLKLASLSVACVS